MSFGREREGLGTPAFREPRAEINVAAGTTTIITGVTGQIIRVYQLVCWARAAANIILKDGATTINGTGFNMTAQSGFVFDFPNRPLTLVSGNSLVFTTTGGDIEGWVEYTIVGA